MAERGGDLLIERLSLEVGRPPHRVCTLKDFELHARPGEFVALLGPSGCGKSTLLGAVGGFVPITSGTLLVDGLPVREPSAERGLVFQRPSLLPWKRVLGNVEFGPRVRGLSRKQAEAESRALLSLVGLEGFERYFPAQLSGGMQQRVEIARVLVNRPKLLLMDEPFGALDAQTRLRMQNLLLDVWTKVPTTVLFVTHDVDEALYLADRVIVLSARPARPIATLEVPFARPRSTELVTSTEFAQLKRRCLELLTPAAEAPQSQRFARVSGVPQQRAG